MDMKTWSKSEARTWCCTMFVGTLVLYAARVALPICAVAVADDYKWDKAVAGTVLSCFFWGYACTQVIGGWLADKYGGENVLQASTLVWVLITLLLPPLFRIAYWTNYPIPLVVLLRVAKGVSQGFHFPCCASVISRHLSSAEKGRIFGIVFAGSHAGSVICGSVGSVVLDWYGWQSVFYLIGGSGLLWWYYLRSLTCRRSAQRAANGSLPLVEPATSEVKKEASPLAWGRLLRHPSFWAAFCAHYCGANAYFTLFSWLPSYFAENFPGAKGWVFNVLPNVAVVSTAVLSPYLAGRLIAEHVSITNVRKIMEGGSLFGLAVCLFVVSQAASYEEALLLFSLAMAFRGGHNAGVLVNPQDFAPNHTGAVFGLMNTAGAIPGFVGVYVAGYILKWTKSWAYVFGLTGMQCLLGMFVYILFGTAKQLI